MMAKVKTTYDKLVEYYEEKHRRGEDMKGLVPVRANVSKDFASVFSVRFKGRELGLIERVALAKGMKIGAFIREAALRAALEDSGEGASAKISLTPVEQETLFQALRQVIEPKADDAPVRPRRPRSRSTTAAQKARSR
jgi:hypothetical protein